MVALNRKISFGKNDWALLVCSLGIPAVPGAIFAALGWFGPHGFWYVKFFKLLSRSSNEHIKGVNIVGVLESCPIKTC